MADSLRGMRPETQCPKTEVRLPLSSSMPVRVRPQKILKGNPNNILTGFPNTPVFPINDLPGSFPEKTPPPSLSSAPVSPRTLPFILCPFILCLSTLAPGPERAPCLPCQRVSPGCRISPVQTSESARAGSGPTGPASVLRAVPPGRVGPAGPASMGAALPVPEGRRGCGRLGHHPIIFRSLRPLQGAQDGLFHQGKRRVLGPCSRGGSWRMLCIPNILRLAQFC